MDFQIKIVGWNLGVYRVQTKEIVNVDTLASHVLAHLVDGQAFELWMEIEFCIGRRCRSVDFPSLMGKRRHRGIQRPEDTCSATLEVEKALFVFQLRRC